MNVSASSNDGEIEAMRKALEPAAVGTVRLRVEGREEEGGLIALIHVFGAYDCKGTEAEITGLLKDFSRPWRIVWH